MSKAPWLPLVLPDAFTASKNGLFNAIVKELCSSYNVLVVKFGYVCNQVEILFIIFVEETGLLGL